MRIVTPLLLALAVCVGLAPLAQAQNTVLADLLISEGDALPENATGGGPTIDDLDYPLVNSSNQFAVWGDLSDGDDFIWYDSGVLFRSSDTLPTVLGSFETSYGIGESGFFTVSGAIDGEDGIWSDLGPLARETEPAPGFPGQFISFASRPSMADDGNAYWISGIRDTPDGSTLFRALYRYERGAAGTPYTVLAAEGDIYEGFPLDDIDFDFNVAANNAHIIWGASLDSGSTTDDGIVIVNGTVLAREASPTGTPEGDNWDNFDQVDVNPSGQYVISGDTDQVGGTADEFIAIGQAPVANGAAGTMPTIVMREGDTIGGVLIDGSVDALTLAPSIPFAAFIWDAVGGTSGQEGAFVGPLVDLTTSVLVFEIGDALDIDGDTSPDFTIDDINTTTITQVGGGLSLSDDGFLYANLDLIPVGGGTSFEALVRFDVSSIIPVELTSFTGVADGDVALLTWETASETNNAGFEVQMRAPGADYAMVGFVGGNGTTTEAQTYTYAVNGLAAGSYSFRLKQIDFDGAFEYSGDVEVQIGLPGTHELSNAYPNPFNPTTQFTLSVAQRQDVTVAVYDALGRQVALLHEGALDAEIAHSFTLDASGLASGAYVIRAFGERFTETQSITLLK